MTTILCLLADKEKVQSLFEVCQSIRAGVVNRKVFQVEASDFHAVPGAPFAYWVSDAVLSTFNEYTPFDAESEGRATRCGLSTLDNFRFLRMFWELKNDDINWKPYFSGGKFSPFYESFPIKVLWAKDGYQLKVFVAQKVGSASRKVQGEDRYFEPGFVFPRRTKAFSPKFMPAGGIYSTAGQAGFCVKSDIASTVALMSSAAVNYLIALSQGAGEAPQFEVGLIKRLPWPSIGSKESRLRSMALEVWSLKRTLDSVNEISNAFCLPAVLRARLGDYEPESIIAKLAEIQSEINEIAFELYCFNKEDSTAALASLSATGGISTEEDDKSADYEDDDNASLDQTDGLLSWAVGVAFGRFDLRLATGEREVPLEPAPLDPIPAKSPGMLPESAEFFQRGFGILVDDEGHSQDLARLVEEVLTQVDALQPANTRRWLQREFFGYHLHHYSKSRRKAPIYWPLSTLSGGYTLWIYYADLTNQTLFTAVNDFIEPKLLHVRETLGVLRGKGSLRNNQEEKQFESDTIFEQELSDLRDALLGIAPSYFPNHDDGVQVVAAPLWSLFRYKPWQKVLKETWRGLEKGDYDWTKLAMTYWPERVLLKCHQDRSLAIAHDVEAIFWHKIEVLNLQGKKVTGKTKFEWQPKVVSDVELRALIHEEIKDMNS